MSRLVNYQPQSSGNDMTKYNKPFHFGKIGVALTSLGSSPITLLEVTGKGYLSRAFICGSGQTSLKITLDDEIIFIGYNKGTSGTSGILNYNDTISTGSSNLYTRILLDESIAQQMGFGNIAVSQTDLKYKIVSLPFQTDKTYDNEICSVDSPLFFQKNLKIELLFEKTTGSFSSEIGGMME